MYWEHIRIGILFNGLVSIIVAGVAFAFVIFLSRRREHSSITMIAFGWFWFFTMLVWIGIAVRYTLIGVGLIDQDYYFNEVLIQASIFFTGPPLFYYSVMRVFNRALLANISAFFSFVLAFIAIWFVLQTDGLQATETTLFSADWILNIRSYYIFGAEILIIFALLLIDVLWRMYTWYTTRTREVLYDALISLAPLIYVALGGIDNSHIILDWQLVLFRISYAGAFLFVYVVVVQREVIGEKYLINVNAGAS